MTVFGDLLVRFWKASGCRLERFLGAILDGFPGQATRASCLEKKFLSLFVRKSPPQAENF